MKCPIKTVLCLTAIICSVAQTNFGITLTVSDDTFIVTNRLNATNGDDVDLHIQNSTGNFERISYVRFDLTPINSLSSGLIDRVYLKIYVSELSDSGAIDIDF